MQNKYQLVLASGSPRRKELLSYLDIGFKVITSNVNENIEEKDPYELVQKLAFLKGEAVFKKLKNEENQKNFFVVSADTIVVYNDEILTKPRDIKEASKILMSLSGKTHQVLTGVNVISDTVQFTFVEKTDVSFYDIKESELKLYLESKDSLDKAGAYGVQGQAQMFIQALKGSYSNVVGFPIAEFIIELKKQLKTESLKNYFI